MALHEVYAVSVLCIPRTTHDDPIDDDVAATLRHDVKLRRVLHGDALYEHVLAIGKADEMCAHLLLILVVVGHIVEVLQRERVPQGTAINLSAAHLLKGAPLCVADLRALHGSPPFTVAVDDTLPGDGNVLALAGGDARPHFVALALTCLLIDIKEVAFVG